MPSFIAVADYDTLAAVYKVIEAQHGTFDPYKTMEIVKILKFESPRGPIAIDPATRDIILNAYFATIPMVRDPHEH